MRLRSVFASIAIFLLLLAVASGATRHAAPAGAEIGTCPSDAPCTFKWAVEVAGEGDEIVVLPGEHTVSGVLQKPFVTVHVHGTATGASAPLITFPAAAGSRSARWSRRCATSGWRARPTP